MAQIQFPSDLGWDAGKFINCSLKNGDIWPDPELTNALAVWLFNGDLNDETGQRTLTASNSTLTFSNAVEDRGIYLTGGDYLEVDSILAPPTWWFLSLYLYTLTADPAPVVANDVYSLEVFTGTIRLRVQTSGGEVSIVRGIDTGAWYRIHFWVTDSEIGLNVNGNITTQAISGLNTATANAKLGGTGPASLDAILDAIFVYDTAPDANMVDCYMTDSWIPVSTCEWRSPVLAPVAKPLSPDLSFTVVDLASSSNLYGEFRGWSEKPAGTYTRITTADGYDVDYASVDPSDGTWRDIALFGAYEPKVFQVRLVFVR